ncbi:MAG: bifunctional UDP-sugar hydrolase/5'-nucleotidase [Eubacteriales bacterium]|nr:bifunctional UDP-sugar hydrolase/5'-nucleotidase [Eubacteriales bacterium]
MKNRILSAILCVMLLFGLCACDVRDDRLNDVIVLFTNDVHCGIDDEIGYEGLSAYKKEMCEKYRYVVLADCGDFAQGGYEGTVSNGEFIVELMNTVGYDFAIFGNHEFDYGIEQLKKNVSLSNAQFLNCNLFYTGKGEDWLSESTKPYEIMTYGDIKVAFIGVSTPNTISMSTPARFMEDGKTVYDFSGENGGQYFYDLVQKNVDECLKKGVDFVVVLSHLGIGVDMDSPFTSIELIANTTGIDVVLDAHSHVEASCWVLENKEGEDVLVSSTGTKLDNIGKLVLSEDGTAAVGYIDYYKKKDPVLTEKIADIRKEFEEQLGTVVAHLDEPLSCYDANGIWMVRCREIALGDFVADAYRIIGGADIGICNAGGIRADLNSGDITYRDLIAVNPFGNALCVVKVTGAEILDMLEYFYRHVQSDYKKDGKPVGEDGSFQQVSGLKFTIDTSIPSPVQVDETDSLTGISGARRISDVMVLKDGNYTPIDPDATYTLASHDYTIKNGGSGMLYFLADHELVIDESISDYQVLIDYINLLDGNLSQYRTVDQRITVK